MHENLGVVDGGSGFVSIKRTFLAVASDNLQLQFDLREYGVLHVFRYHTLRLMEKEEVKESSKLIFATTVACKLEDEAGIYGAPITGNANITLMERLIGNVNSVDTCRYYKHHND
ncbi:hypothetical protein L2E82_39575 [Cichorium intybus]|uniref:Uncharacterized protein n=1 Tax=Cichorium intybus TaxID=13427 RepID=A0ACB9AJD0_CICIN|nr:hypothetical protein L2E82_39575 [Cichorium intybus]